MFILTDTVTDVSGFQTHFIGIGLCQCESTLTLTTAGVDVATGLAPGLGLSHAAHFVTSGLFSTKHVSHVQPPEGGLYCASALLKLVYKQCLNFNQILKRKIIL